MKVSKHQRKMTNELSLMSLKLDLMPAERKTERSTDYGRPMKPFFIEFQNFWAWADKFWGIWGIFGQTISSHFGTVSPLSMFSIIQPLFIQKTKKP